MSTFSSTDEVLVATQRVRTELASLKEFVDFLNEALLVAPEKICNSEIEEALNTEVTQVIDSMRTFRTKYRQTLLNKRKEIAEITEIPELENEETCHRLTQLVSRQPVYWYNYSIRLREVLIAFWTCWLKKPLTDVELPNLQNNIAEEYSYSEKEFDLNTPTMVLVNIFREMILRTSLSNPKGLDYFEIYEYREGHIRVNAGYREVK
jgi:hypothetical protein